MLTALVIAAVLLVGAIACEGVRACCVRMLARPVLAEPMPRTVEPADHREPVGLADLRP